MTISSSIQRAVQNFREHRAQASYERQKRRDLRSAHRHLVREAGRQDPRSLELAPLVRSAPLDLMVSMMRNIKPGVELQAHLEPFIQAALREKRHDVINAAIALGATWSTMDTYLDDRFLDALNANSTPEQLNTVLRSGRPAWQGAFNRFCLSDASLEEWVPMLDAYLAAGATGASRNQALVEGAAMSVVFGGRGYRGGVMHGGALADGTYIDPHMGTNFVPLSLADPLMRQQVLNFALRNLYENPDLVKALLAEGGEPGLHQVKHAAQDAVGDPTVLASVDLLLTAGGDVDNIEDGHWSMLPDWLKIKHSSIVSRDMAILAAGGGQTDRYALELGHCYGSVSEDMRAAIDEAKRRAVPGRITAEMLNGSWIPSPNDLNHGFPNSGLPADLSAPVQFVPLWVHLLFRMPESGRQAELERLIARGADVTREGIARHTDYDPQGLVQACFDAFPEVRIHVENAELRQFIEDSTIADETQAETARRRL
ncbi:hypothetical protein KDW85_27165 [Burkholderia cenocepacia]|uniref:hypothetical protein n=1 Tax=Burkholderia cenocepacia TaxID=95486 RepID=UPI001B9A93D8|nr:hypothetical protein [Burkholderia cenocepacia]MBR8042086.1 hypothetical protein [Burkholderia cenocepacia]